ncbi:hypothetical protein, partial [Haemophilus influenzae]|uniref:hypothetical protein n=1 Tax=Haemophilus influenzae TaxID=727 RepID=UPI001955129B
LIAIVFYKTSGVRHCFLIVYIIARKYGIQEVVGSIPIISTKLIKQGKAPCFFIINNQYLSEF